MKQDSYTLAELAEFTGASLQGDAHKIVSGLNTLQQAGDAELSFLANPAYARYLDTTKAGAVILGPDKAVEFQGNALVLGNPYLGYAKVSHLFDPDKGLDTGIHPSAVVSPEAEVHAEAAIGPNVVIEAGVVIARGGANRCRCCCWA